MRRGVFDEPGGSQKSFFQKHKVEIQEFVSQGSAGPGGPLTPVETKGYGSRKLGKKHSACRGGW